MSSYYVGLMFCLVLPMVYPIFRSEATAELLSRGIRIRDIRRKQKGAGNFWFYIELEAAYGLGRYGKLLRLYPIIAGTLTAVHIPLGWITFLSVPDLVAVTVTALYLSAMILMVCVRRNRRLFGETFVLWGKRIKRNHAGKRLYIEHYSIIFDLAVIALPLTLPAMMGWFKHLGW